VVAVSITPPMVTAVSRIRYSMALNQEMPRALARLHPRYGVPHVALLASGAISIVITFCFANQFDTLTSMVNFGPLTAFIAVNASVTALFMVKRKSRKWLSHVVSPALGIAALAVIVRMSKLALGVGFAWMAIGFIAYRMIEQRKKKT
jgi:amino acid transporter